MKRDGQQLDLERVDLAVFGLSAAVGFVVVLLAALGFSPLGGAVIIYLLGYAVAAAAHGALVALLVGLLVELGHGDWTNFGGREHVIMEVSSVLLAAGLIFLDRWVVNLGLSSTSTIVYFVVAVLVSVGAGVLTGLVEDPNHFTGRPEVVSVMAADVGGGVVAGAALMVFAVAGLAFLRQHETSPVAIPALTVQEIGGDYLALGDSYSAGEGLRPFNPGTATDCHRSEQAYSQDLTFAGVRPPERFAACAGAVLADVYSGFGRQPQVDGGAHSEVRLVTLTMSGNDVLFSKIVVACLEERDCLAEMFHSPPPDSSGRFIQYPPSQPLRAWASETASRVNARVVALYAHLRHDYPRARIVVLGYPYLFPAGHASWWPNDCASILRRLSLTTRDGIRTLMDGFNNMLYADAVQAGIEFVSPTYAWSGHEPCGSRGQYTNSIKPILKKNPIDGGTFHPNANGQREFAYLVSCYLNSHPTVPNAFAGGTPHALNVTGLVADLRALGLVDPSGSATQPLNCSNGR